MILPFLEMALQPNECVAAAAVINRIDGVDDGMAVWMNEDVTRRELAEWYSALPRLVVMDLSIGATKGMLEFFIGYLTGTDVDDMVIDYLRGHDTATDVELATYVQAAKDVAARLMPALESAKK